jgi:hypothetical protein
METLMGVQVKQSKMICLHLQVHVDNYILEALDEYSLLRRYEIW